MGANPSWRWPQLQPAWVIFGKYRWVILGARRRLWRREEFETALAQPAVCRETRMRGKPARDGRRVDGVAVARGQAAAGFVERVAAVVRRERVKDFVEGIGFVAQRARAGREGAAARPASIQPDRFEFLGAAAPGRDPPAVAGRAALGRLYGRSVVRGCSFGRSGHSGSYSMAGFGVHAFARRLAGSVATNLHCETGRRVFTDMHEAGLKMDAVARSWLLRSCALPTARQAAGDALFLYTALRKQRFSLPFIGPLAAKPAG